jgi:hypothetical protein
VATVDEARRALRRGPDDVWVERSARLGLAARGLVYGVVGLIALEVAWRGAARDRASKGGAIAAIAERPLGRVLLIALAVGFAGFVVWRTCEALWGRSDERGDDQPVAAAKRAASAGKALVYVSLVVTTVRVILAGPEGAGSEDQQSKGLTARVLDLPGGRGLVAAVGVALLGAAVWFAYRGVAQHHSDRLDTSQMSRWTGRFVDAVGTLGMAARGMVLAVLGLVVLQAAIHHDPDRATGIDGALRRLARQPYGQLLLTATAIGIVAFGLYSFAEARYREV